MIQKQPRRNLIKFSNYSTAVVLPKKLTEQLGWQAGDNVAIHLNNETKEIVLGQVRHTAQKTTKNTKPDKKINEIIEENETPTDLLPIPEL